jgi:hypothetical protein
MANAHPNLHIMLAYRGYMTQGNQDQGKFRWLLSKCSIRYGRISKLFLESRLSLGASFEGQFLQGLEQGNIPNTLASSVAGVGLRRMIFICFSLAHLSKQHGLLLLGIFALICLFKIAAL